MKGSINEKEITLLDPKLPLEILETVLEFLSPPHTSSTFPTNFCLLNKASSVKSIYLLYKHAVIPDLVRLSKFQSTLNRLQTRSEVVKHLSIFLPLQPSNEPHFNLDLLQFTNLVSLSLDSQSTSESREKWKSDFPTSRSDPFPRRFPTSLRSLTFGSDAFNWFSTTGKEDLVFKSQPRPLPFEDNEARDSDSYHYKNWTFGKSEDDGEDLKGKGLKIIHLHLYSPKMSSRVFTRLRTSNCFPHLEALTLSLPSVAHPDDLRLLKRTLKHLTNDEEAWVYGSKRTFSRGLKRITIRIWGGWVDKLREHLGLDDQSGEEDKIYDEEKLDRDELIRREMELREQDTEARFRRSVRVEVFEVEAGKWRSARSEEFKRGGWIGDLVWE